MSSQTSLQVLILYNTPRDGKTEDIGTYWLVRWWVLAWLAAWEQLDDWIRNFVNDRRRKR